MNTKEKISIPEINLCYAEDVYESWKSKAKGRWTLFT